VVAIAWSLCAQPANAQGNKALMEDWARKKQQTKDEVYKELKRQGAVPHNGTITFEATVKPDPRKPDAAKVRIDSVVVKDTPAGQRPQTSDPVFGPRDPGTGPVRESGTIQTGTTMRETITVTNGVPDYKAAPKWTKP
jgi:hypothetical protein